MDKKKTFWSSLPGILTGIAALITAIGGTLGILYQAGIIGSGSESRPSPQPIQQIHQLTNLGFEKAMVGWYLSGPPSNLEDYTIGNDKAVVHKGSASGYVRSKKNTASGWCTLMRSFDADIYRGTRLRMTAYVKTQNVSGRAGLWMRVDGPNGKEYSFDNMQNRPIKGDTEWSKYDCILDVPEDSKYILFGLILEGSGKAWVDDFSFETVGSDVPTTDR
ncbi:hypothetical protein ACFL2O_07230 [Thermodesulfobacteriota bacterium]